MALQKTSTGIVDKQPTLAEAAASQGQQTPTNPLSASELSTTPKQQDMAGTPNQVEGALKDTRDTAQPTLTQTERYTKPVAPPEGAANEAKDKAEALRQLGPVQTRVQALIQQRIQEAQTSAAQLGVNQQAIEGIQDLTKRQQTEDAFTQYLNDPTEANLQQIYDTVGSSALEDVAIYFQGAPEAIKQAIAPAIVGDATLDELNLEELGVDVNELATTLNVDPTTLQGMSLNELNAEIDALQAAELSQTDQWVATLRSPNATPQQKQAAIEALRQLGVEGIPGAEQAVERVQEQIDAAQTIEIAGRELSLEQALSDEGISALVSQASYDDDVLRQLKEDPRYAALADWIETNKEALASLATEYAGEAQDFLRVQDEWSQVKSTLGEGGDALLATILGEDLADSVLSTELEDISTRLADSALYQEILNDDVLREELKTDPTIAQEMIDNNLTSEEIQESRRIKEAVEGDEFISSLIGIDKYPTSKEDIAAYKDKLDRLEGISPDVLNKGRTYAEDLNLDLLEDIDASDNSDEIFTDIAEYKSTQRSLKGITDTDTALTSFFGSNDWSANDLNWAIKNAPKETVDNILAIFDEDGDGVVTEEEIRAPEVVQNIKELLGDNAAIEDIIGLDGKYDPAKIADTLMKVGVDKQTFERAMISQIENNILEKEREASDTVSAYEAKKNKIKDSGDYATLYAQFTGSNGANQKAEMQSSLFNIKRGAVDLPILDQMKEMTLKNASHNMFRVRSALAEAKKKARSGMYPTAGAQIAALDELHRKLTSMAKLQKAEEDIASLDKRIATQNSTLSTLAAQRQGVGSMDETQLTDLASLLGIE